MAKRWDFASFREDMRDPDPDKPHQAMFDLSQELDKPGFVLDEEMQHHVFQDVLRQALSSCHSDVQGAAVKCIPALVKKVKERHVSEGVMQLSEKLADSKKEHRDIATISLKYIVECIPATYRDCLMSLAAALMRLMKTAPEETKLDIMDVCTDLLRKFGASVALQHEGLQMVLTDAFESTSYSVRKRAISALAALSQHSSEPLFLLVIKMVVNGIEKQTGELLRKHIQLCSTISRTAGHRLSGSLDTIIPLLLANLAEDKLALIEDDGERNEVKENVLQAFESFVKRCPQQVSPFLKQMIAACKEGMSYDPYYDYDEEMDEPEPEEDEYAEDDYAEMLEAEADDDDDVSWKVRKASAKCLSSIIEARPDSLEDVFVAVCSGEARAADVAEPNPSHRTCLLERFKEREESVRLDILKVFSDLLKATQITNTNDSLLQGAGVSGSYSASFRGRTESRPEVRYLIQIKDFAVDSLIRVSKDKSMKVKTTGFQLLKLLTSVLRTEVEDTITKFLRLIKDTLSQKDATSTLKTEVLQFLMLIISYCPANSPEAQQIVPELLSLVLGCVCDKYYRIMSESLRVCGELAPVIAKGPDAARRSSQLYDAVFDRLKTVDVDQEVKDCAIATMASVLSNSASKLDDQHLSDAQVSEAFKQYLVLLGGDYTRLPVIKALTLTRDVPIDPELLNKFMAEMCGFLRKASRPLRQASLVCLKMLTERKIRDVDPALLSEMLLETVPLLSDADLHLSHLAIDLADAVLRAAPSPPAALEDTVLPQVVVLLRSPLLQGSALESLETLFQDLGSRCRMGYHPLLQLVLSAAAGARDTRQVLPSVAAVTARLTSMATEDQQAKTVEQYVANLSGSDTECALGLSCLGEVGRFVDLSQNARVLEAVRGKFYHAKEDVKMLTATALGKITVGNPSVLLPDLLESIEKQDETRYLLLRALKETLARSDTHNDFDPIHQHLTAVLDVCMKFAGSKDEGTRNVVAECLGKLAVLDSQAATKRMLLAVKDSGHTGHVTATVVTAMKYAVSEPHFSYEALEDDLQYFLCYMRKPEGADKETNAANVKVRKAAVQMFTAAVHSKPHTVRRNLKQYIGDLLDLCRVDQELVRQVNLGAFVHKVDDGLELRKASFECIDILFDGCFSGESLLDYLNDYAAVAAALTQGMTTAQGKDIQILNFIMFGKMCRIQRAHVAVLSSLPTMFAADLLPKIVSTSVTQLGKESVVQQDKDKISDLLVSMLKMIQVIKDVPSSDEQQVWKPVHDELANVCKNVRDRSD